MPKYIVVVGGVISGVGKGVSTAALGKILQEYGYSVTALKIDPYLNYDAGTLRPTEHGEVWVTHDGGEIDQDLGNYERFLNQDLPKKNCMTSGQVYYSVIERERKGGYLGQTISPIPHIPDEVKKRVVEAGHGYDFVLVEVGGTIGDYENVPFLFAMKSLERELGKENVLFILVTYLLVPRHCPEMKTKPTQQAIKMLSESAGIFPDFILCRGPYALDEVRRKKIEVSANIPAEHIISEPDIESIYQIPLDLEKETLGMKVLQECKLQPKKTPDWSTWKTLVDNLLTPQQEITIALVGKYVGIGDYTLADSYVSINQALLHAGAHHNVKVNIAWVDANALEEDDEALKQLSHYQGILIPGGFGSSGVEGKIKAIRYAREQNIPFLGLCYGMQLALVEFARNVCGLSDAHSTEVQAQTTHPIIDILPSQKKILELEQYGGTMRLGSYAALLKKHSQVYALYEQHGRLQEDQKRMHSLPEEDRFRLGILDSALPVVLERHRHRYEVNPAFIHVLEEKGMHFSGYHVRADQTKLMEFIELPQHPFFIATQAHPEFKSRLTNPAPLFMGFISACKKKDL